MLSFILVFFYLFVQKAEPVFSEQVIDNGISIGYGITAGDVDGDGKPDIILADKTQFVWYRNGDWKKFILAENLTAFDNVCIAARDIDGDGKVEIAVGAQWNPGETSDAEKSGAVFILQRPDDPARAWKPLQLPHEPTVHRMRWVKAGANKYHLIMLPLHGRGNRNGEGRGVNAIAYEQIGPDTWTYTVIDSSMHLTHNFDVVPDGDAEQIYIGGKEGIKAFRYRTGRWEPASPHHIVKQHSVGEIRVALRNGKKVIAAIEPMHGNLLSVYPEGRESQRRVVFSAMVQGHALAVGDLHGDGRMGIVAGWREPNAEGKTGIKLFTYDERERWTEEWIDENGMACEDLQLIDLNGDSKLDIIAAGRASRNVKVYWNISSR